jgi:hypothetical protein
MKIQQVKDIREGQLHVFSGNAQRVEHEDFMTSEIHRISPSLLDTVLKCHSEAVAEESIFCNLLIP